MYDRQRLIPLLLAVAVVASACGRLEGDLFSPVTTQVATTPPETTPTTMPPSTTTTMFVPDLTAAASGWSVSLRGVGPFQIGMPLEEAERAAGAPLFELDDGDPACSYFVFNDATGIADQLRFMVRAGMIARIDVDGRMLQTLSGVGVGSTTGEVLATYGESLVVSPGDTGEANHDYLTFIPSDEADLQFRLRFEAIDDVVTTYRIGKLPEVEWVGRCE